MTTYRIFYDYYVNGKLAHTDFVDVISRSEELAREAFIETHTPESVNFSYTIVQVYEVEGIYL